MPYKVFKSGSKWCVHKLKSDGSKGSKVRGGCHPSKSEADKHQRALAVNVKGSREVTVEPIDATDGLLSVVRNVELCAVGIEYPLASGPATFTPDDLVQAVASQDDPAIQAPRVWLGHPDDQRFHAGRTTPAGSAEPALGKVLGMRVEDEGMTLVGDIHGCPTWLASILASAYPNRSVEGFKGAQTVTGHRWDLVITDLALLGVTWPGVSTLSDLEDLYSEDGPDGVEVNEEEPVSVRAIAASAKLSAQAELDKIRRAFVANLPEFKLPGWPWIRAVLQDPNELIVDDDEGGLYRVSYDASGDEVTFGEPTQVKVEYVNASQRQDPDARGLLVNMLTRDANVVASWGQRAASRPDTNNQESGMNPEQIQLLRARLGLTEEQLPDDATEDQITAALADPGEGGSGGTSPGGNPGGGGTSDNPSPDQLPNPDDDLARTGTQSSPGPGPVEGQQAPPQLPEGYVAVPADAWAAVQANAAAGAQVAQRSEAERRQAIVAEAVKQGRISPAQRANFEQMFDRDPQGTENLLTASVDKGGLMPGTIPVEARGADPSASDLQQEAYPASWLPELQTSADGSPITMEA